MPARAIGSFAVVAALLLASCGDAGDPGDGALEAGPLAVSVDDFGEPVVIGFPCEGSVDAVTLTGRLVDTAEEAPDPELGRWIPATSPADVEFQLALAHPGDAWRGVPAAPLLADRTYTVTMIAGEARSSISFGTDDLSDLAPGVAVAADGHHVPVDDVLTSPCPG